MPPIHAALVGKIPLIHHQQQVDRMGSKLWFRYIDLNTLISAGISANNLNKSVCTK